MSLSGHGFYTLYYNLLSAPLEQDGRSFIFSVVAPNSADHSIETEIMNKVSGNFAP